MTVALLVLAAGAAVGGTLGLPGEGHFLHGWLAPVLGDWALPQQLVSAALHWGLVGLSVTAGAAGLLVAWGIYRKGPDGTAREMASAVAPLHRVLERKYYVDEGYALLLVRPLRCLAVWCYKVIDTVIIDIFAVRGVPTLVKWFGLIPRTLHNGNLQRYLFAIVLGLVCLWIIL